MPQAELAYVLKVIDETSSTMEKIRGGIGLVGSTLSQLGGGFTSVGNIMTDFAVAGPAGAAIGAFGELAKGLQDCIKEAADSEAVFTTLGAAVTRSGTAWASVAEGTKQALLAMQATTTYSDEQLAAALEKLMTFGLSYDQAMKALGATVEFAAAKHMDLESAASLVGKAVDGNTAIMKRYGVDITVAKDATDKFTPVIAQLNTQFGGAAQAAASTYVGIQERLKNATQEVGEKIGTIVLPALASLTEGMIPVVDWLGKGVDAVSAWLTEVGKMPEVQGAIAVVNEAFQSLGVYMSDVWKFIVDNFGPVLTELMAAFKELWDAISPIGEALKELWDAITGGTGDMDLFKAMLLVLVINIRAVAEIIKEVAPYIKQFATMFKEAADFITPILTQIGTAIRTFVDDLKAIFQGFYTWLVGGSLWMDLWNRVLTIAGQMVNRLLSDLGSKFFEPMKTAFTTVTDAVKRIWETAWEAIRTAFSNISNAISTGWQTFLNAMQGAMSSFWSTLEGATTAAFGWLQGSFTSAMWAIQGILSAAIGVMQSAFGFFWQVIQGAATTALWVLQGIFTSGMGAIRGTLDAAIAGMEAVWTAFIGFMSQGLGQLQGILGSASASVASTVSSMQGAANSAVSQIQGAFSSAWGAITSGAQDLWGALVGHSIWTDMLDEMQTQTYSALGNIAGAFQGMSLAVPAMIPYSPPAAVPSGPVGTTTPQAGTQAFSFTIPITVTLDGQVISRQVEQRIVERVNMRGKKVA